MGQDGHLLADEWAMHRLVTIALLLGAFPAHAADDGLAARCAVVRDDDTIHGYEPPLHAGLVGAFEKLFPGASIPPDERTLEAGAHIRCMDGRLFACFTGANLPCGKMNTVRDNHGAEMFCRENPDSDAVPAYATGHETIYTYRCVSGRPRIDGTLFTLDRRGFAAELWTPLN
jgi:hypothetical protein